MSQRNLTSVLLKVLGVVSIIRAVHFVSLAIQMLFNIFANNDQLPFLKTMLTLLPSLTPLVSFLVLAFILLRYANPIAARLFPAETSAFPDDSVPTDQWYVFAFTVLGVALLVWYVPLNIGQCVTYFVWPAGDAASQFRRDMRPFAWQALLRVAMQLALGLYLILGSRKIVAILRKLRRE